MLSFLVRSCISLVLDFCDPADVPESVRFGGDEMMKKWIQYANRRNEMFFERRARANNDEQLADIYEKKRCMN